MVQFTTSALLLALLAAPSLASHVAHEHAHGAHPHEAIDAREPRIGRFLKKAGSPVGTATTVAGAASAFVPAQRDLEGVEELDARFGRVSGMHGGGPRRGRLMAREPRLGGRMGGMGRGMGRGRMMSREVQDFEELSARDVEVLEEFFGRDFGSFLENIFKKVKNVFSGGNSAGNTAANVDAASERQQTQHDRHDGEEFAARVYFDSEIVDLD